MNLHPATLSPTAEVFHQLSELAREGQINQAQHRETGLVLFNYGLVATKDFWTPLTRMARGIVFDSSGSRVVAHTIPKFFNLQEHPETQLSLLLDRPFWVDEKLDGSMGTLFHWQDRWHVATRGSFHSSQAQMGLKFFTEKIDASQLDPTRSYILEITSPDNQIVVPYREDALYLLASFSADGEEADPSELDKMAARAGFKRPRLFEGRTLADLVGLARTIPFNEEGFVVRFKDGLRVKIKGEEYCRIHRLITCATPLGIYEFMLAGKPFTEFEHHLPEEFRSDARQIHGLLEEQLRLVLAEIQTLCEATAHLTNKELGLALQADQISGRVRRFLFAGRKPGFQAEFSQIDSKLRRSIFEEIRPQGNRLPGYEPSRLLNRFQSEQG
jgi:RNA ligase